jgi:hypothetical protein
MHDRARRKAHVLAHELSPPSEVKILTARQVLVKAAELIEEGAADAHVAAHHHGQKSEPRR